MSFRVIAIGILGLLCFHSGANTICLSRGFVPPVKPMDEKTAPEAMRLWEQAIEAKGGRERLHAVRNLVITSHGVYFSGTMKKNKIRKEILYALPDKLWGWIDLRPGVFGLSVTMYNLTTQMKYAITDTDPNHYLEPLTANDKRDISISMSLLSYLPETKWWKPELVTSSSGRLGLKPVDIVQTQIDGKRVDFALDRKSHLPVRITTYTVDKNGASIDTIDLLDYVDIDGIKMPATFKYDDGTVYKQTYQLNVNYNENIFLKPPSIESGPEVWKLATNVRVACYTAPPSFSFTCSF